MDFRVLTSGRSILQLYYFWVSLIIIVLRKNKGSLDRTDLLVIKIFISKRLTYRKKTTKKRPMRLGTIFVRVVSKKTIKGGFTMATHRELTSIEFNEGNNRFCIDRLTDREGQYAFVWRGTSAGPNAFIPKPAYFEWELLGQAIRQAFTSGQIPRDEINSFFRELFGI